MDDEISRLTLEVIGGKPISDIPVAKRKHLKEGLLEAKSRAILNGQLSRLKRIQQILSNLEEPNQKRKKLKTKSKKTTKKLTNSTETIQSAIISHDISAIKTEEYPSLLSELRSSISSFVESGDLVAAQQYEDLRMQIRGCDELEQKSLAISVKQKKLRKQICMVRKQIKIAKQCYEDDINKVHQELMSMLEKVEQQNSADLNTFDQQNQTPLPPFTKPLSSELINMREQTKKLILTRHYLDASRLRDTADKLEMEELELDEQKRIQSVNKRRKSLIVANQKRIDAVYAKYERQKLVCQNNNMKVIHSLEQALNNLEMQIETLDRSQDSVIQQSSSKKQTSIASYPPQSKSSCSSISQEPEISRYVVKSSPRSASKELYMSTHSEPSQQTHKTACGTQTKMKYIAP